MARMTPKQWAILDFLHDHFEEGDGPIGVVELAERTGFHAGGMSLTMFSLKIAGLIEMAKSYGVDGRGSGHIVHAVNHPSRGRAAPEPVAYDMLAGCYRFSDDMLPTVKRLCLACNSTFETPSRFVRFCSTCKSSDDWMAGADNGDYLSNGQAILSNRIGGFRRLP